MGGDGSLGEAGSRRVSLPDETASHRARVRETCTARVAATIPRLSADASENSWEFTGGGGTCRLLWILRTTPNMWKNAGAGEASRPEGLA